jgi:16S rRNA (guanine(966)-N(2))-methyltransferase RsmD
MVRLTGGLWKGRRLAAPQAVRATAAKVRLALFNILRDAIDGARVLDGFAGSGAVGLDALSRGAAFVAFVEQDTESVLAIRENLERLSPELPRQAWRLIHQEFERGVRELAKSEAPFDVIWLDPPYRSDEGKNALNALAEHAILAPAGIVAVEHYSRTALPGSVGPLQRWKQHRYGDTVLSFYRLTPAP